MLVKIEDLKIGDEILIGANSNVMRARVMRDPRPMKTQPSYANPGETFYTSLLLEVILVAKVYTYKFANKVHTYTKKTYMCEGEYNHQKRVDLNRKNIWLLEKKV
jgi:hypothetical protein